VGDHGAAHPLTRAQENENLARYEQAVKAAFDDIVPALREVASLQHLSDFEQRAQSLAMARLGITLPGDVLARAWVEPLDMRTLYAACVFETYRRWVDKYHQSAKAWGSDAAQFLAFLQRCGYHYLDFTPCADGRLAHAIRYVLRLPESHVRRKAHAGAMFDVDDSIGKWIEVEHRRHREALPNAATAATRYLKVVMYHFCPSDPRHEGCAAHGSDDERAAQAGLSRLEEFKRGIENSFCCGASIDLLLVGIDTDSDAIRVHVPDGTGAMKLDRYVDALDVYKATCRSSANAARETIRSSVRACLEKERATPAPNGLVDFIVELLANNISQIDYVRRYHGGQYGDVGHNERFIGTGAGFDELQLRNLTYFAYLKTVEEGAADLDVGIKIFNALNLSRGLPVPIVVRFDYASHVPGARARAVERCLRVGAALEARYPDLRAAGKLHTLLVVRDSDGGNGVEVVGSTVQHKAAGAH
jgi:carboxysome shell carbonic anhydrase